ncbi:hypothetical protein MBANPS3_012485 [Mucor bainieri]
MDCTIFWKKQEELGALVKADANTSKAANNLLISNSARIVSTTAEDFEFSPVHPDTFLGKKRYQETLSESSPTPHPYDQTATTTAANAHHLSADNSLLHPLSNNPSDHTTIVADTDCPSIPLLIRPVTARLV